MTARSLVDKVMWVGRATVFAVGLVAILALLFAAAYVAFGTLSGKADQRDVIPQQVGSGGDGQVLALETLARRRAPSLGFAQVNHIGPSLTTSKEVVGVERPATGVYCFNLSFDPKVAVASGHFNNNLSVGTYTGPSIPNQTDPLDDCSPEFRDAAAKTYAANTSEVNSIWSFGIVFMR